MAYVTKQWSYLLSGVVLGALMGQLIMGPGTTCQLSNDAEKETERIVHHSPCPTPNPCPTTPCQSVLDRMGPRLPNSVGNPETRDSWIARKAAEVPRGSKVLDVSAGAKPYKHLFSHCQYYSHEFSGNSQIVDGFRGESSVSLKQHDYGGDVTATTAPSNEFDVVLLTEVLEHVPEPLLAIQELARVAKPGARIFVTSPFTSGSHQQPYHFSSGYSREWYNYAASRYKLRVVSIETQGDFFQTIGARNNPWLQLCRSPTRCRWQLCGSNQHCNPCLLPLHEQAPRKLLKSTPVSSSI